MSTVTAQAPAKINLWLSVGPLGADGFHPLATVFQSLTLYDLVHATTTSPGSGITLTVEGADGVPVDRTNLAWSAASLVADELGIAADVSLHLVKRIPVAGGMAGGSADAAATLVACDALWRGQVGRQRLMEIAATLGSDVPFMLHGGTAIGTGRGDRLIPVLRAGTFHWVLAAADRGLSTPAVYGQLDRLRADHPPASEYLSDDVMSALRAGDALALGSALGNDLQQPALSLMPSLGQLLTAGVDAGALGAMVSGSGPTCVFLARDRDHALDIAARLSGSGLCRTVACAAGPTAGAQIIDG